MDPVDTSEDERSEDSTSSSSDSDFEYKLLKTKFKVRVKNNDHLRKIGVPKETVRNIEIEFYNFDTTLATFITSFTNLKSLIFIAVDDYFFNDEFVEMVTNNLPELKRMDIRIWRKLDRFHYNEYDIEEKGSDIIYNLMVKRKTLRLVKVLSKYDFSFANSSEYNSIGIDKARESLENFGKKLKSVAPRFKYEFRIPLIDCWGTGYSFTLKK